MTRTATNLEGLRAMLARDDERLHRAFEERRRAPRGDAREGHQRFWSELDECQGPRMAMDEERPLPPLREVESREGTDLPRERGEMGARRTEVGEGTGLHRIRAQTVGEFMQQLRHRARRENALSYGWADQELLGSVRQRLTEVLASAQAVRQRLGELLEKARFGGES